MPRGRGDQNTSYHPISMTNTIFCVTLAIQCGAPDGHRPRALPCARGWHGTQHFSACGGARESRASTPLQRKGVRGATEKGVAAAAAGSPRHMRALLLDSLQQICPASLARASAPLSYWITRSCLFCLHSLMPAERSSPALREVVWFLELADLGPQPVCMCGPTLAC